MTFDLSSAGMQNEKTFKEDCGMRICWSVSPEGRAIEGMCMSIWEFGRAKDTLCKQLTEYYYMFLELDCGALRFKV